eukprot:764062-Hanusia_phi.AAC.2
MLIRSSCDCPSRSLAMQFFELDDEAKKRTPSTLVARAVASSRMTVNVTRRLRVADCREQGHRRRGGDSRIQKKVRGDRRRSRGKSKVLDKFRRWLGDDKEDEGMTIVVGCLQEATAVSLSSIGYAEFGILMKEFLPDFEIDYDEVFLPASPRSEREKSRYNYLQNFHCHQTKACSSNFQMAERMGRRSSSY